ncbi:MAG: hypothetical protein ABSF83_03120 [Nitrososphaerales archaeon]
MTVDPPELLPVVATLAADAVVLAPLDDALEAVVEETDAEPQSANVDAAAWLVEPAVATEDDEEEDAVPEDEAADELEEEGCELEAVVEFDATGGDDESRLEVPLEPVAVTDAEEELPPEPPEEEPAETEVLPVAGGLETEDELDEVETPDATPEPEEAAEEEEELELEAAPMAPLWTLAEDVPDAASAVPVVGTPAQGFAMAALSNAYTPTPARIITPASRRPPVPVPNPTRPTPSSFTPITSVRRGKRATIEVRHVS